MVYSRRHWEKERKIKCKEFETRSDGVLVKHKTHVSVSVSVLLAGKIIQKQRILQCLLGKLENLFWEIYEINKI
jgi:hypothetical protein